jgi:hypothetical protein
MCPYAFPNIGVLFVIILATYAQTRIVHESSQSGNGAYSYEYFNTSARVGNFQQIIIL